LGARAALGSSNISCSEGGTALAAVGLYAGAGAAGDAGLIAGIGAAAGAAFITASFHNDIAAL
jgi:hypothetical protein